jgi:hypothetical protein
MNPNNLIASTAMPRMKSTITHFLKKLAHNSNNGQKNIMTEK